MTSFSRRRTVGSGGYHEPLLHAKALSRWSVLLSVLAFGVCVACGSHRDSDTTAAESRIEECDSFAAAYADCLKLGGSSEFAEARAQQFRSRLKEELTSGKFDREALRAQCSRNQAQLRATCR